MSDSNLNDVIGFHNRLDLIDEEWLHDSLEDDDVVLPQNVSIPQEIIDLTEPFPKQHEKTKYTLELKMNPIIQLKS